MLLLRIFTFELLYPYCTRCNTCKIEIKQKYFWIFPLLSISTHFYLFSNLYLSFIFFIKIILSSLFLTHPFLSFCIFHEYASIIFYPKRIQANFSLSSQYWRWSYSISFIINFRYRTFNPYLSIHINQMHNRFNPFLSLLKVTAVFIFSILMFPSMSIMHLIISATFYRS